VCFIVLTDVKRAESMKADVYKKPKRTPSFTTRRRTQSFRKLQKLENVDQLPPVEIQGFLDRKHELQSTGKKAAVRSWKTFYTGEWNLMIIVFYKYNSLHTYKSIANGIMFTINGRDSNKTMAVYIFLRLYYSFILLCNHWMLKNGKEIR